MRSHPCAKCGSAAPGRPGRVCQPCRAAVGKYAPRPCVTCGAAFRPHYGTPEQVACSRACRIGKPTPCLGCGLATTRNGNQNGRYCGPCGDTRNNASNWGVTNAMTSIADIAARDGYTCQLCFTPVDMGLDPQHRMAATRDHVIPQSLGGGHGSANLRLAHRSCNSSRKATV